jgi:hypothetical protein
MTGRETLPWDCESLAARKKIFTFFITAVAPLRITNPFYLYFEMSCGTSRRAESWDLERIAEETALARSRINSTTVQNTGNTYEALTSNGITKIKMYINGGNLNNFRSPIGSNFPKVE